MSLSLNDIVQVTWQQVALGVQLLNVQYLQVVEKGPFTDLNDICQKASGLWITNILPMQSSELHIQAIAAKNLTNGVDIATFIPEAANGGNGGDMMPPYVAWAFQQVRATALTRHGHKFVGGIPETSVANGVSTVPVTGIDFFKNVFSLPWERAVAPDDDHNFVANPVIIGRTETPPASGKYELDLAKVNQIQGLLFRSVSTFNTRKFGRGV